MDVRHACLERHTLLVPIPAWPPNHPSKQLRIKARVANRVVVGGIANTEVELVDLRRKLQTATTYAVELVPHPSELVEATARSGARSSARAGSHALRHILHAAADVALADVDATADAAADSSRALYAAAADGGRRCAVGLHLRNPLRSVGPRAIATDAPARREATCCGDRLALRGASPLSRDEPVPDGPATSTIVAVAVIALAANAAPPATDAAAAFQAGGVDARRHPHDTHLGRELRRQHTKTLELRWHELRLAGRESDAQLRALHLNHSGGSLPLWWDHFPLDAARHASTLNQVILHQVLDGVIHLLLCRWFCAANLGGPQSACKQPLHILIPTDQATRNTLEEQKRHALAHHGAATDARAVGASDDQSAACVTVAATTWRHCGLWGQW